MTTIETLVRERSVLVCCGSGGVGKTTVAASLALCGATLGRRCCVVTIDPARRLADALSEGAILNSPHEIEGPWSGSLFAVMLDAKVTFDDLVRNYAADEEQAERILANRVYRNLVSALSGTQEYMATEKLFELHDEGAFDLVVVDTPPARNALDFLAAPSRLAGFLDNRLFRALLMPGRAYLRAASLFTQTFLRTLSRVAGGEIVEDTMTFFQAFEGMEQGFRDRAAAVERLLSSEATSFVLVGTPQRESVDDATYFAQHVVEGGQHVGALVMNRMLPDLGDVVAVPNDEGPWSELVANLNDLTTVAHREELLVAEIASQIAPAPVARVPLLGADVHDMYGLSHVARYLVPGAVP